MNNLNTVELKTFIPAKNFDLSKQFYSDLGFTMASDVNGIAYFHHGSTSFLLQDFYDQNAAENKMMHLLVEDVHSWYESIKSSGIDTKYNVEITNVVEQPWGMLDFVVFDPSGVLWRFAQNI